MPMICVICGGPAEGRYATTAVCDGCKPVFYERIKKNEDAVRFRQSIEEIQRAPERREEKKGN